MTTLKSHSYRMDSILGHEPADRGDRGGRAGAGAEGHRGPGHVRAGGEEEDAGSLRWHSPGVNHPQ